MLHAQFRASRHTCPDDPWRQRVKPGQTRSADRSRTRRPTGRGPPRETATSSPVTWADAKVTQVVLDCASGEDDRSAFQVRLGAVDLASPYRTDRVGW